jgi:hypothetical protein
MAYFFSPAAIGFFVDDAPMPEDVLPVTDEQHAALMAAQAAGARIRAGAGGTPEAVFPTDAERASAAAAMARAARTKALDACIWTQLPDAPLTDAERAAWAAYRTALRDWPAQPGWPDLALPTPPG